MQEKQKKLQEESRADQEYIKKWQVFFFNFSLPVRQRGRGRESGGREKVCVLGGEVSITSYWITVCGCVC